MTAKKIEFTDDQYHQLTRLIYLGYWMYNANKDEPDSLLDDFEQYIYSFASSFGYDSLAEYDITQNKYFPSTDFEEEMEKAIQEYDEYIFWEELAWRMAERDFTKKYDHAQILCMTGDEILREKNTIADKYFQEFGINGVENMNLSI